MLNTVKAKQCFRDVQKSGFDLNNDDAGGLSSLKHVIRAEVLSGQRWHSQCFLMIEALHRKIQAVSVVAGFA